MGNNGRWEVWSLYPQQFTTKLESLFLGKPVVPSAGIAEMNMCG